MTVRHTKYTMAVILADLANVSTDGFIRVDSAPAVSSAPRPQFEEMLCESECSIAGPGPIARAHEGTIGTSDCSLRQGARPLKGTYKGDFFKYFSYVF